MRDITKAQLTIGLLAFFATVWALVKQIDMSKDITQVLTMIALQFVLMLILSIIVVSLLEWVKVFDLKTNAILTMITLITIPILSIAI